MTWLDRLLMFRGLPPHGYCLLWDPLLVWTHVVSDLIIAAAYFSIPFVLLKVLSRRRDLEFSWLVALFAIFIFLCGATHIADMMVLWIPAYGLQGILKALTALASIGTAIALWRLLPQLIAIPSPRQLQLLNDQLAAEMAERQRTEDMLRQSQKLEAVGQLTAGIAHDFNNLLTVIVGNLERAEMTVGDQDKARGHLQKAQLAAERAANLTSQLLAFARKQPLNEEQADVNAIVTSSAQLFGPTLGEGIECTLDLDPELPPIRVDRDQLQNAILNLAINARDAMGQGGRLTIRTRREGAGLRLEVTDTGHGMSADVAERAMEPFFTTKPLGQGSGLGLSQVYGFVQQAGGDLAITSAPGTGTTVAVLLHGQGAVDGTRTDR